jgi:hypothetical protein
MAQKLLDTVKCPDGRSTSSGQMMMDCLASGRLTGNFEFLLTSL